MKTEMRSIKTLHPYDKNTKKHNKKQIDNVAESISQFGFVQPIVIDNNGVIVIGHCRYAAARKLGLDFVPVVCVENLTEEQVNALRIIDNKTNESAWDFDMLKEELPGVDVSMFDMDLDMEKLQEKTAKKAWENAGKKCNLQKKITVRNKSGFIYTSFFSVSKEGQSLEEIKADKSLVPLFADNLYDYLYRTMSENIFNGLWAICTTPRRRHKEGFHFATEICKSLQERTGIKFYENLIVSHNSDRINPVFTLEGKPKEKNLILYDDIISTGTTIEATRKLLISAGYVVMPVIAIRNQ